MYSQRQGGAHYAAVQSIPPLNLSSPTNTRGLDKQFLKVSKRHSCVRQRGKAEGRNGGQLFTSVLQRRKKSTQVMGALAGQLHRDKPAMGTQQRDNVLREVRQEQQLLTNTKKELVLLSVAWTGCRTVQYQAHTGPHCHPSELYGPEVVHLYSGFSFFCCEMKGLEQACHYVWRMAPLKKNTYTFLIQSRGSEHIFLNSNSIHSSVAPETWINNLLQWAKWAFFQVSVPSKHPNLTAETVTLNEACWYPWHLNTMTFPLMYHYKLHNHLYLHREQSNV